MFTLRVKESHSTADSEFSTIDDVQKISNKASALYDQFLDLFDEQERMMETADLYKQFNEKMNSKLVLWSEIEIILLILLTLVHIYYIKSFFEIKTIV
ncbi:cop-coated vesicle membrane protein p24 precursor, putative [Plasmodium ovale wallikeri]|nr:cop-coated vesicle membrane protein p24 precursor, putative [Plasmodium ovale wallikeri]SBT48066.1 cop-coated vesicle membrane protein p24 precursor, putative [Plasmodium ovale wallikeri]